uniref:Uncharacterized protein n=1 Tax=Chelydra serpentina TaxID=8475 RepID=A0A8C3SQV1_CHESE
MRGLWVQCLPCWCERVGRLGTAGCCLSSDGVTQQEEVGAAAEELHGEGAGRRPPDGVIGAADAQDWDGCLVRVPEGVVAIPVRIPGDGLLLGLAEEGFLKLPERAAPEQPARLHHLCQRGGVPGGDKGERPGRGSHGPECPPASGLGS